MDKNMQEQIRPETTLPKNFAHKPAKAQSQRL